MYNRESNYDLLRGLCMLAVIASHVSGATLSWNDTNVWIAYLYMGGQPMMFPAF